MPRDRRRSCFEECLSRPIICSTVHHVHLRISLRRATRRMNMETPKVLPKFQGFLNGQVGKILTSEDEHLPLSCKESQLIFADL